MKFNALREYDVKSLSLHEVSVLAAFLLRISRISQYPSKFSRNWGKCKPEKLQIRTFLRLCVILRPTRTRRKSILEDNFLEFPYH